MTATRLTDPQKIRDRMAELVDIYANADCAVTLFCDLVEQELPRWIEDEIWAAIAERLRKKNKTSFATPGRLTPNQQLTISTPGHWFELSVSTVRSCLRLEISTLGSTGELGTASKSPEPIKGFGRTREFSFSICAGFVREFANPLEFSESELVSEIVDLVHTCLEAAYSRMHVAVVSRIGRLCKDIYIQMYAEVRSVIGNLSASGRVFLTIWAPKSSAIYLPDTYAIEASLEAANAEANGTGSALDSVARFWDSFARGAVCFPYQTNSWNPDLKNVPYSLTGWQLAERAVFQSDLPWALGLVDHEGIRVEAWFPPAVAEEVNPHLFKIRPRLRSILIQHLDEIANELGDIAAQLSPDSQGGFLGGGSVLAERVATLAHQRNSRPNELSCHLHGEFWTMNFRGRKAEVPNITGMRPLVCLLERPHEDLSLDQLRLAMGEMPRIVSGAEFERRAYGEADDGETVNDWSVTAPYIAHNSGDLSYRKHRQRIDKGVLRALDAIALVLPAAAKYIHRNLPNPSPGLGRGRLRPKRFLYSGEKWRITPTTL